MGKLFRNLTFWVLVAITGGILLGHYRPDLAQMQVLDQPFQLKVMGQELSVGKTLSEFLSGIFISLVKLFINPIIFLTITLGIVSMGDLKKVGRVGAKSLLYFEIVTTFALVIGILAAMLIQPGSGVDTSAVKGGDISKYTKGSEEFSWLKFLKDNFTLQVLIVAIITGVSLTFYKGKDKVVQFLQPLSKYIFKGLHWVMLLAPVGAFGGMAFTISKYGISTLLPLAKLMGTVYITMALFIFIVLYFILRMYRVSIFRFLKYIREELLVVLGTSSSEAALPTLMEKLERMGCSKSVVGLVVPTGYSFNLDGTTIYLSMCMIFLAQVFNVDLSFAQVLSIIGILMLTSKGAAGVTGSGFVVLASTLTAIKVIPVEGLALLLGVDRFMSEARAITNFIGNGVATIWIANNEKEFDRNKMELAFNRVHETEDVVKDNIEGETINH
ncbi:cation:dicarboxylase symporter family transporter [Terrimonas sp. NA20]|uniref:Cation:dicarboxylase symporter family transporter n=1 Tax=Terrimonas ginsenosidimutans TaxID=2908004 RepID=A0ABS9KQT7_9BACT|nr:cation:dicarboxylase symporter family transporter [Terrimonas ginsenosidimutans]MCG2614688.1 cation:dicarboxylase symporter family transporter [Terrimonas ginsenosidimutans]